MLADAGLDNNERNLVMTAISGDFSPHKVAQELRNQFPENEVRRRDQSKRYQSYLEETLDESDEDLEVRGNSAQELEEEGLSEEGIAMVVDAEEQAQQAMAALFQAKRTLKEARQRQHLVKQSRRYYVNGGGQARSSATSKDDSNLDCLRCGKRGHRAANCPHKPLAAQAEATPSEMQQAPFVCYLDRPEEEQALGREQEGADFAGCAEPAAANSGDRWGSYTDDRQRQCFGGGAPAQLRKVWLQQAQGPEHQEPPHVQFRELFRKSLPEHSKARGPGRRSSRRVECAHVRAGSEPDTFKYRHTAAARSDHRL